MNILSERAPAKVNLTLRVVSRRADGYHELESLVAFADVADSLDLVPNGPEALDVTGPFAAGCGSTSTNLVIKAVAALRARVESLKAGRFRLAKRIPVAAGLGGGSADAGAALRLLARANGLRLDDPRLVSAARAVGADVPVCLAARSRIIRGIGDVLSEPLALPRLAAVLVNPGTPLPTREVFDRFSGKNDATSLGNVPSGHDAFIAFLLEHENDLTRAAVTCVPAIGDVLKALRALSGARLARMTGSGPTCFALFDSQEEAAQAARRLQAEHRDWWVCAARLE